MVAEADSYRLCSGVLVLNREGLVFLGKRIGCPGNEVDDSRQWWQMPQGGIDEGESARDAALRELREETSICSVEPLGEIEDWLFYDLPFPLRGHMWGGRYCGQKQKWFAFRFVGDDSEINICTPAGGCPPEFLEWCWAPMSVAMDCAIPFKKDVYHQVFSAFSHLA
ncbi:MAG: RNA pyrophosphohydrolase [Alphaproteobacteria bacterium]|nr:RNA pyrophosphohydrolase [Alphaproteobacteria bacterium]